MARLNASSASLSLGMQLAAATLFVWLGRWFGALARATRKELQPAAEATSSSNLFIADERCFMARGARSINSLFGYFGNEPARSI
jgi:hypothetical protein